MNGHKKEAYLKIYIAVDTKSKKNLSLKVTYEHIHDNKMLPRLIKDIIKSKDVRIDKILADGAYVSNAAFRCLSNNRIMPCMRLRKNAKVKPTNHVLGNLSVIS